MESNRDGATTNGVLIIVDSTGIPVLVRPYGDVQKPPSAAIGIVSAVFHASTRGDGTELRALQSQHRSIVYVKQVNDFLLAFVQTRPQDYALVAKSATQRMLRLVFHALRLMIGPSLTDLESSKLRGAIARQLAIIDFICTQFTFDVSLATGRPTFALHSTRGRLNSDGHPPTLLYAARIRTGIVESELCSLTYQPAGLDLLTLCAYAQVNESQRKVHTTIYTYSGEKKPLLKSTAMFERSAQDDYIVGIFAAHDVTSEPCLETATLQLRGIAHVDCWSSVGDILVEELGLLCFVVTRDDLGRDSTVPLRGVFCSQPPACYTRCDDDTVKLSRSAAWRILGRFVLSYSPPLSSTTQRLDWMQQKENCTLVHCHRAVLSVFAVFIGQVPVERINTVGDLLASAALRR